jgi:phosphoglycerate dehydrogenase-like enzyme
MRVLFCDDTFPAARETLRNLLPDMHISFCKKENLIKNVKDVDVAIPLMARLESELITCSRLLLIQQYGVGLEGVDVDAATRHGVFVANVPAIDSANSVSVAELVIWYMITLIRRTDEARICFREGKLGEPLGDILRGKKAGIIGLGHLGRTIVTLLKSFGMHIYGIRQSPLRNDEVLQLGLDFLGGPEDLDYLLSNSDFVILCLPLTTETAGMINKKSVKYMKKGAFLINVSRGPVIEYEALLWGLSQGQIAGAGFDVFWTEPMPAEDPIFRFNVVATPHIGGLTSISYKSIGENVAQNIKLLAQGLNPLNCVNLERMCFGRSYEIGL